MNSIKVGIFCVMSFFLMATADAKVFADSALSLKEKSIVSIAALTAKGDLIRLKKAIEDGLQSGLTINQIKEVEVHLYAYCGFPRSIRGIQTLMQVIEERKSKGINDVNGKDATPIIDTLNKYDRGKNTLSKLTNSKQERPVTGYGAFAPAIDLFLKEHLFADIFDRDVLTYAERELVTIAVLSAIGNADPMLRNHYSICINLGITENKLYAFTETIKSLIGNDAYFSSKKTLDELFNKKVSAYTLTDLQGVFEKGEKINSANFQGTVYLNNLIIADSINTSAVGNVTFEPGARTKWHMHPAGQIILVIDGIGYYQEKGQPKRIIKKGDVVKCQPNLPHWHGASANSSFIQVAITNRHLGETVWMQEVTDEEYNK